MVSYPYQAEFLKDGSVTRRPIVPLNISGFPFTGLLDSGSDVIVIPLEVAEALQLKKIGKTSLSQMNGDEMECIITELDIEFGTDKAPHRFKTTALISNSERIILGREGFFSNFRITFNESVKQVSFKPNKNNLFNN
ncbi:MAG: retropepsin-like domain-containing protein [Candidatus Peregrinibacteria bacterium]|nr:retropepsin-like domain-containing protein [Candidatus Peregrinibacteria bacterium]